MAQVPQGLLWWRLSQAPYKTSSLPLRDSRPARKSKRGTRNPELRTRDRFAIATLEPLQHGACGMKIVVAYSGGLDTSVILKWIQATYSAEVIAFCADIGDRKSVV